MLEGPSNLPPQPKPWLRGLFTLTLVGLTFALGASLSVSRLEENDRFCASCHMVPERTYYNRTQYALAGIDPALDLASAHYLANPEKTPGETHFRCIDCHRGNESLLHRATALALGARDTAVYLLGQPDQDIEKKRADVPHLLTESCVKCHTDSLLVVGFPNHLHNKLPSAYKAWQQGGILTLPEQNPDLFEQVLQLGLEPVETDLLCGDCHFAHTNKPGSELTAFLDLEGIVYPACEQCHIAAFSHPLGLSAP